MIELQPSTLRNRHTIENDIKTALIKRINRAMKKKNSRTGGIWKVKVGKDGVPSIVNITTGKTAIEKLAFSLNDLAAIWGVTNATAGCDVTLPTKPTAGKVYYNKKGKPCFSQEISSRKVTNATVEVAPSYSSHY